MHESPQPNTNDETPSTDKTKIMNTLKEKAAALPEAAGLLNRITAAPSLQ